MLWDALGFPVQKMSLNEKKRLLKRLTVGAGKGAVKC